MKLPRQFRIPALLAIVAVAAIGFASYRYFSPSARYQRNGDVQTLRHLLSTQIESGDSLAHVTSILGSGNRDDGDYLARVLRWQSKHPEKVGPERIEDGDLFIHYSAAPKPSYPLQFRDGVLVNHDPKDFVGPDNSIAALTQ